MKTWWWILITLTACSTNKQLQSIHPFQGSQGGCGNFMVYKLSEDKKQVLSIVVNMQGITPKALQSYGLDKTEVVEVTWKMYAGDISPSLCNDVLTPRPRQLKDVVATSGLVDIFINDLEREKIEQGRPYKVTIVLRKIAFEGLFLSNLRIENVNVGWLPG